MKLQTQGPSCQLFAAGEGCCWWLRVLVLVLELPWQQCRSWWLRCAGLLLLQGASWLSGGEPPAWRAWVCGWACVAELVCGWCCLTLWVCCGSQITTQFYFVCAVRSSAV